LNDLVNEFTNVEIVKSDPVVPYKETIISKSSQICMAKSSNGHNRISLEGEPLDEELVTEIENGQIDPHDTKKLARILQDKYNWDSHDAKKVWVFGPEDCGPSLLVDTTKSVQFLNEINDSMKSAFQESTKSGVLADEIVRGMRYNIVDVVLHPDSIHRGGNQIIPTAKRLYLGTQLTCEPRFVEPIYLVDISCPSDSMSGVYQCFNKKRGVVFSEEKISGTPMVNAKAYLPVSESFGFSKDLMAFTSGKAFPQCIFDHWDLVKEDPLELNSKGYQIMMAIRKRKGLKLSLPKLEEYLDKK